MNPLATAGVPDAHARTPQEVCAALASDVRRGLTNAEAQARLAAAGPNELAQRGGSSRLERLVAQFTSPLVLLLIVAAGVSFAVWVSEREHPAPYEALAILAIVLLNAALGYVQEARAEAAIAALSRMTAPSASVIRDGERTTIPAREIVPGDLLHVEEGDSIAADARLVSATGVRTVEGALTGESVPVEKDVPPVAQDAALGDRHCMLLAGTSVVSGHATALVTATGMHSEVGRIASLLQTAAPEPTPLQRELATLGKVLGMVVIAIAVVVAVTILVLQRDFSTAALVGVLLYTVALAVSAVPEGLAAVTTIVLSLGTRRMAARNAIVRRLSAVETLGATTVIATDKTGTLTVNELTVRAVETASGCVAFGGTGYAPVGEVTTGGRPLVQGALRTEVERLLTAASLASNAEVHQREGRWSVIGDPTEGALHVAVAKLGIPRERLETRFARVAELPFTSERKLMSTAHADRLGDVAHVLFVKGAPDLLLTRCVGERVGNGVGTLDDARRQAIERRIVEMAAQGLRTLGVAYRPLAGFAAEGFGATVEQELVWLGVIGMADPPRPEAKAAVASAQQAGVRVVMITGDHPAAAAAIAVELGIAEPGARALTGVELARLGPDEQKRAAQSTSVYARVAPEQKLDIVRALKANGHIVAMTGDGVNDAPALRAADIGIAMGRGGTDVAREAASMVLADDNFATIVAAIEEGRRIYANIQKVLRYLLGTNLGEVLVMFFGVVLASTLGIVAGRGEALVLPLLATMILWINLVTDGLPALALGVDEAEKGLMQRRPRDPRQGVVTRRMWAGIIVAAIVMAIGTLLLLDADIPGGLIDGSRDIAYARTMAFHTLVLFQLVGTFCVRSDIRSAFAHPWPNRWLWSSLAAAVGLQAVVLYVPALQRGFGTVPLDAVDWLISLAVASTILVGYELLKVIWRSKEEAAPRA
jgi:Ca2+-transporting ATPase